MIDLEWVTGVLAVFGLIAAEFYYIRGIFTGRIKPHIFSWIIWGTLMGINALVQMVEGADLASSVTAFGAMLCLLIAWLARTHGEKHITKSDWYCFCTALAAMPLWVLTREPLCAAILITMIDGLAFIPTIRKTWHAPESETCSMYLLCAVTDGLICLSVHPVTLAAMLYPASGLFTNTSVLVVILLRSFQQSFAQSKVATLRPAHH